MQNQSSEFNIVILIGVLLGVVLVGFIITIVFLYQRRQYRQEKELRHMKDQYQHELLRSQLEIQENTFKTIAQELHDNIGQLLSVVKISLAILPVDKDHEAYEPIQNSRQVLNKAIVDLSNLTKSLHTDRITHVGLPASIQFELEALKKAGIVDIRFSTSGTEFSFPEQKAIFIFRIFQEILNNILKHSQATCVEVFILYTLDYTFVLEIRDNGVGFNVTEKQHALSPSTGVGLKSVFNRAQLIGADLKINSEPGKGTDVIIKLACREET